MLLKMFLMGFFIFLLIGGIPFILSAQEFYCYEDPSSDARLDNCSKVQKNKFFPIQVHCWDSDTSSTIKIKREDLKGWKEYPEGDPRCQKSAQTKTEQVPRGETDSSTDSTDDSVGGSL